MSYADRCIERAYRLADDFARSKIRENSKPDIVWEQSEYDYRSRSKDIRVNTTKQDGWVIVAREGRCIVALEDGGVIEGELKIRAKLFRRDRNIATNYAYWTTYNKDKVLWGGRKLTVDIAEVIILKLGPPV